MTVRRSPLAPLLRAVYALAIAAGVVALSVPAAAADTPVVTIQPAPNGGVVDNGQTISIQVGANKVFTPGLRIEVLECAAPGGVLPTSDLTCDGNTVQYGTVLVAPDGSISVPAYSLLALPNSALSETPSGEPVCNLTHECVLYVGQNQNDFTAPKAFSAPFRMNPATPTPAVMAGSVIPGATGTPPASNAPTAKGTPATRVAPAPTKSGAQGSSDPAGAPGGPAGRPGGDLSHAAVTPVHGDGLLWLLGGVALAVLLAGGVVLTRRDRS